VAIPAALSRPYHSDIGDPDVIPLAWGLVYLFAVLEWASRRGLAWRRSNKLTIDFCLDTVQEVITRWY
jgi:putative transposase